MQLHAAVLCVVILTGAASPVASQRASAAARLYSTETLRVTVTAGGVQGIGFKPTTSHNGRFVAFEGNDGLAPGDTNSWADAIVLDRVTGSFEVASVASDGTPGNGHVGGSFDSGPAISYSGRYVVFEAAATNLVAGDTNGWQDVFVRDRQDGITERVSVSSAEAQANGHSYDPTVSADGRFIAFRSNASNLVAGDTNDTTDVFVRDRLAGTTERVSVSSSEAQGNSASGGLSNSISIDGRFVAFQSYATNLVAGDTNDSSDAFVRDRQTGTTERISVDSSGVQGYADSTHPVISADGLCVAFVSGATNLDGGAVFGTEIFVHDRPSGMTQRVTVGLGGAPSNWYSEAPSISRDGRHVTYLSQASNLVVGDTNGWPDIFVSDRLRGTTVRASVDSAGAQGNFFSLYPVISADGRSVVFESFASNLVPGDTNSNSDCFIRTRHVP